MKQINVLFFAILFLAVLSCKKGDVRTVVPEIELKKSTVLLGLYGVSESATLDFSVFPSDAEVSVESSTEDIVVTFEMEKMIPIEGKRHGTITFAPGEGWRFSREEKSCEVILNASASGRTISETVTVRMDNNGMPYVESFPKTLLVYPYRASLKESFDVSFVSPYDTFVEVYSTLSCLETSYSIQNNVIAITVTPKADWNESGFYGMSAPGMLSLNISNEAGNKTYTCPVSMPKLNVSNNEAVFPFHGGNVRLDIVADVPYKEELVIPDPLIPGDPSEPLWNPNNPLRPSNDPREWVSIQSGAGESIITAAPIKRKGERSAVLKVSDEKGVFVREVELKQNFGGEYDYCDNITDFEALWLIYEQMSPARRVRAEQLGWGSANMRDWDGAVTLQRGERVIHFTWSGEYLPEEVRVFKQMTELQMTSVEAVRELPSWLYFCPNIYIGNSNFTGPIPEWFAGLSDYCIGGCRFYGLVPDVVRKTTKWQKYAADSFNQQEGYYLYYLDDNGNPVDYNGNPLDVPAWQRTDLNN